MVTCLGDDGATIRVTDENRWTVLRGQYAVRDGNVIVQGDRRVLHDTHPVAILREELVHGLPTRTVDKTTVHEHDILRLHNCYLLLFFGEMSAQPGAAEEKHIRTRTAVHRPSANVAAFPKGGREQGLANMNMIIHDMEGEIEIGDTFRYPKFRKGNRLQTFDRAVANPMWNQTEFTEKDYDADELDRFPKGAGFPGNKADWGWVQHILASLNDSGKAAVVLDTGAASPSIQGTDVVFVGCLITSGFYVIPCLDPAAGLKT